MNEIKNLYHQSEQKRIRFEARFQTQWEDFVKKVIVIQGSNNNHDDSTQDETDDLVELDEKFPITIESQVGDLEWSLQQDVMFKHRLVNWEIKLIVRKR